MAICQCYHAGFTRAEIAEYLDKRVSEKRVEDALLWEQKQIVLRSEVQSVYDAWVQVRALKRKANAVLERQFLSLTAKTRRFAIKEIAELIDQELEYANRLRELSREVITDAGHVDIANLPAGVFSADLEPDGGGDTS